MSHDVFISHSDKDKSIADAVCATLEARGIRCWIAPRDILPGMDWGEAIIQAIAQSRLMVLIFSSNANNSHQIKREVERAASKEVPIVPFRIENVMPSGALEYFLSTPHWLDALTPPLEKHLQYLADTILQLKDGQTSKRESNAPPPQRHQRAFLSYALSALFIILGVAAAIWLTQRSERELTATSTASSPSPSPIPSAPMSKPSSPAPTPMQQPPVIIQQPPPAQQQPPIIVQAPRATPTQSAEEVFIRFSQDHENAASLDGYLAGGRVGNGEIEKIWVKTGTHFGRNTQLMVVKASVTQELVTLNPPGRYSRTTEEEGWVHSRIAGTVVKILVSEGQQVHPNDVLMIIRKD